ncbi:hypothetical protein EGW08_014822, partial [Elysia chlorotica]
IDPSSVTSRIVILVAIRHIWTQDRIYDYILYTNIYTHNRVMPSFCAVIGCANDHKSGNRFFSIHSVRAREGEATKELLERRRRLWMKAINCGKASSRTQ